MHGVGPDAANTQLRPPAMAAIERKQPASPSAFQALRVEPQAGAQRGAQRAPIIQRAITIGMNLQPRTVNMPPHVGTYLRKEGIYDEFVRYNDDRENIYIFSNEVHMVAFLKGVAGVYPPLIATVPDKQLLKAHKFAQDLRFDTVYQPSSHQISETAPGGHNIPTGMMPTSGVGHYWGQSVVHSSGQSEYTLYQNQLNVPQPTMPLTYGDPQRPSLAMNQGGLNLAMYIAPTYDPAYLSPVTRQTSAYGGGIPTDEGRVRGHAYALRQNQIKTDEPKRNFDNDRRAYTDESNSTYRDPTNGLRGGVSTHRYNEVENKTIKSGLSFTQTNNNPVRGAMGIARPDSMSYRMETTTPGVYDDFEIDNTHTVDYAHVAPPKGVRKQAHQTSMGRTANTSHPYVPPPVRQRGDDFLDPDRYTYSGYLSPPPTPYLSEETLSGARVKLILSGDARVGSRVKDVGDGTPGIVDEVIDRDRKRNKARCWVKPVPQVSWHPGFA